MEDTDDPDLGSAVGVRMAVQTEQAVSGFDVPTLLSAGARRLLLTVTLPLVMVAAAAWWLTASSDLGMAPSTTGFLAAWMIMMAAMMLPAVAPVVALYAMAAKRGLVAALPVFVLGYLGVWALSAVPALLVSRLVSDPLMTGEPWVARVLGVTLLAAAAYECTPIKQVCLRHCRSPLSFFLSRTGSLARPATALAAGARHGLYCLGCCWALMAVLIVLGGMQLGWALVLALVLSAEKLLPRGDLVVRVAASAGAVLGTALLWSPSLISPLTL